MPGYMPPAESVEWETPQDLFDILDEEFHFDVDVAATSTNAKCPVYFTKEQDALAQEWPGICFCNPPYGKGLDRWVRKALESATGGTTVVMLLPARTDTRWFHDYVLPYAEIRFIKGRLKFGGQNAPAPFPNMIVVFRPYCGKEESH